MEQLIIDYDVLKKAIKEMRWKIGKETAARLIRSYHVHANKHKKFLEQSAQNQVETEHKCERCGKTWIVSSHPDAPFTFVDCGCPTKT